METWLRASMSHSQLSSPQPALLTLTGNALRLLLGLANSYSSSKTLLGTSLSVCLQVKKIVFLQLPGAHIPTKVIGGPVQVSVCALMSSAGQDLLCLCIMEPGFDAERNWDSWQESGQRALQPHCRMRSYTDTLQVPGPWLWFS